jgi:hypothetical protein
MNVATNSQRNGKRIKMAEALGRPRKRDIGEDTSLSFRVADALVRALDAEAEAMNRERVEGHPLLSRGDVCRILLNEAIAAHAKARAERSKTRQ